MSRIGESMGKTVLWTGFGCSIRRYKFCAQLKVTADISVKYQRPWSHDLDLGGERGYYGVKYTCTRQGGGDEII